MSTNKQLRTEIIALCDYASVSKEGKLSINGIFDELRIKKFPGGIARAFLVATVNGTPNTPYALTLKVDGEGKSPINDLNLNAMTSANGKNNLIVELINLGFQKEGDYNFKIFNGSQEVGSTLLKVIHVEQNQPAFKMPN